MRVEKKCQVGESLLFSHVLVSLTCTDTYEGSLVNRQVLIKQLPPVLVLNIKRFIIGISSVYKNTKHLSFPHVLNMAPYCTNECAMVCYIIYNDMCICTPI